MATAKKNTDDQSETTTTETGLPGLGQVSVQNPDKTYGVVSTDEGDPALHVHNPIAGVALASPVERMVPVTHPASPVVGADAYNRAVTKPPVAKGARTDDSAGGDTTVKGGS